MVLQGDEEGFSPPFDSSLYGASFSPSSPAEEFEIEYEDCDAIGVFFQTTNDVRSLLPEGIEPLSDPPQAGIMVTRYPFSTVGTYNEYFALVQVKDTNGEMAYYIPYIYVTNDAAMASGREVAGAPKKMADIEVEKDKDVIQGTMERPAGKRLFTVTVKPEERAAGSMVDTVMPSPTPLLSVRHMPPIQGGDGLTQLVKWYADIDFYEDSEGVRKMWMGPCEASYDSHSSIDPIHKIEIDDVMMGTYARFDMVLGVTEVLRNGNIRTMSY
ncbi:MAG: acetoacetate decarboxylase family protein, partial [Halobacteria archaeon]|nr:acetoacetate decarboxylase family protein [Halobacteria archaeon]